MKLQQQGLVLSDAFKGPEQHNNCQIPSWAKGDSKTIRKLVMNGWPNQGHCFAASGPETSCGRAPKISVYCTQTHFAHISLNCLPFRVFYVHVRDSLMSMALTNRFSISWSLDCSSSNSSKAGRISSGSSHSVGQGVWALKRELQARLSTSSPVPIVI